MQRLPHSGTVFDMRILVLAAKVVVLLTTLTALEHHPLHISVDEYWFFSTLNLSSLLL